MQTAPSKILLHKKSKTLELGFPAIQGSTPQEFLLGAEYLRVYSPSAEVKGHTPAQAVLQTGKKDIGISSLQAVGNYAVRIFFDDDHDSGLYTWEYLYDLGINHEYHWNSYLAQLQTAGKSRDPNEGVVKLMQPPQSFS